MSDIDTGLNVWQMNSNHNRMIEIQNARSVARDGPVEIAFYGSSAFKVTSPIGVSVMIDPWRNHPSRSWDWYFHDFPITAVDIGTSTHAHFDHDALHRLDAHVLLDRLIGRYTFADMTIEGLADKHETDTLRPHVVIPHHYYIWDVVQRQSTLQGAESWVQGREGFDLVNGPRRTYAIKDI